MMKLMRTGAVAVVVLAVCGLLSPTNTMSAATTITPDSGYPTLTPPPSGNSYTVSSQGNWTLNTYTAHDVKVYIRFKKPDDTYEWVVNGDSIGVNQVGYRSASENQWITEYYGTFSGNVTAQLEQGKTYEYKIYLRANDSNHSPVATWKTGTTWHTLSP